MKEQIQKLLSTTYAMKSEIEDIILKNQGQEITFWAKSGIKTLELFETILKAVLKSQNKPLS
jgi:hypothetical protein